MTGGVKRLQVAGPLGGWCWVGGLAGGGPLWGPLSAPVGDLETWWKRRGRLPREPSSASAKLIGKTRSQPYWEGGGRSVVVWRIFCSLPALRVEGLAPT